MDRYWCWLMARLLEPINILALMVGEKVCTQQHLYPPLFRGHAEPVHCSSLPSGYGQASRMWAQVIGVASRPAPNNLPYVSCSLFFSIECRKFQRPRNAGSD